MGWLVRRRPSSMCPRVRRRQACPPAVGHHARKLAPRGSTASAGRSVWHAPSSSSRLRRRADTGPAQGERFPEGQISKIEFEGNATITADKIKPKLLSRVGQPLDQDRLEADLKTLMGTKWFSDVKYYLDESPPKSGKWALIFVVREMPLLTKVEFRGRKAIRLKEIEDTTGSEGRQPRRPDAHPVGGLPDSAALSSKRATTWPRSRCSKGAIPVTPRS